MVAEPVPPFMVKTPVPPPLIVYAPWLLPEANSSVFSVCGVVPRLTVPEPTRLLPNRALESVPLGTAPLVALLLGAIPSVQSAVEFHTPPAASPHSCGPEGNTTMLVIDSRYGTGD